MQNNAILLQSLTVDQLQQLIGTTVRNSIVELQKQIQKQSDNEALMTRDETCQFLKVDSSTLWAWTNHGKVKAYGIGARRYTKKASYSNV